MATESTTLLQKQQFSFSITSEDPGPTETVYSDEDIAESLVSSVFEFKHWVGSNSPTLKNCNDVIEAIENDITIIVVDREINHLEEGGSLICWNRKIDLKRVETISFIGSKTLAALRTTGKESIDIITITKSSFAALKRHRSALEQQRLDSLQIKRTYTTIDMPSYRSNSCCDNCKECCDNACECTFVACACCCCTVFFSGVLFYIGWLVYEGVAN